jgi:ABC-type phosphate transport system substrate-binding protein
MIIVRFLLIGLLICELTTQTAFAHGELVVIVNPHSSFNSLTKGELRRIFLGQTGNFPNGQPAEPFDVANGYRDRFYQVKTPESVENYWANTIFTGKAQPPRQLQPNETKQQVATLPRAISYIDRSQVDASIKVINVVSGQ